MKSLPEFYDLLRCTDWTYEMSDDSRAYKRGAAAMAEVRRCAELSAAHKKLYDRFSDHVWRGADKPERPKAEFVSGLSDVKAGG